METWAEQVVVCYFAVSDLKQLAQLQPVKKGRRVIGSLNELGQQEVLNGQGEMLVDVV